MDTKSKNRHKFGIVLILGVILLATVIVLGNYNTFYKNAKKEQDSLTQNYRTSESFMKTFIRDCYVLYSKESGNEYNVKFLDDYYPEFDEKFNRQIAYINYQVQDANGEVIDGYRSNRDSWEKVKDTELADYALGIKISFDKNGEIKIDQVMGTEVTKQEAVLKILTSNLPEKIFEYEDESEIENISPKDRTYYFMMTEAKLNAYVMRVYPITSMVGNAAVYTILTLILLVALLAWLIPMKKDLHTGDEKIFHVPFEIAIATGITGISLIFSYLGELITHAKGNVWPIDFLVWFAFFAVMYWVSGCVRQIRLLGVKEYVKKRVLLIWIWRRFGNGIRGGIHWCKDKIEAFYHSLDQFNFKEKNNKIILKIVLFNFAILLVICSFWYYGIAGLIVYSVILFLILQKYFNDLRKKYALLLEATNKIADGNLDVEIEGDLGVFSPFRNEIQKIQTGFKKAVKEEVKSQRMKTELITNVSHDLKTPLTAITTYIELLKKEDITEEERRSYIDTLERKSLRLKVLIEDLFEVSKANSNNIVLNKMELDVVNLIKQVSIEHVDKMKERGLELKWNVPEEKVLLMLDNQKTYRIFENLFVNVVKYAMQGSRVYLEVRKKASLVEIILKNMSAEEIHISGDEITERFVRGDSSRNTEGSGLGLAIAKSFTEAQGGEFHVEVDGDLFKVVILF